MFFANFLFLIWRLFNRMAFTGMIYNLRHALMAAPRLVVGNFVNFFATWRAVRIYLSHRISGTAPSGQTSHSYPVHMTDLRPARWTIAATAREPQLRSSSLQAADGARSLRSARRWGLDQG